ncbi:MAG: pentapeptide repeat-containing protein [Planctomycetes bacterium]|nr:pentapeptide repeat-containing protein [Planctomycetota bacterium]
METTSILALLFGALDGSVPRDYFNKEVLGSDGLDLSGIELEQYDLRGLTFRRCVLRGAKMSRVRADGVSFEQAVLDRCDLSRSTLIGANLQRASVLQADLSGADLTGADLTWCVLRRANLDGVDLGRATLWKTDLREATYPDFAFRPEQDILHSQTERTLEGRVSLREFLAIVSELGGTDYVLPGTASGPKILIPEDIRENPAENLAAVVRELGLRVVPRVGPTGSVLHYEVVQ